MVFSMFMFFFSNFLDKSEIKTSVDLMKNAAGDNDRDIELVRFFEETCALLTPIIEMKKESSFDDLFKACKGIKKSVCSKIFEKVVCLVIFVLEIGNTFYIFGFGYTCFSVFLF